MIMLRLAYVAGLVSGWLTRGWDRSYEWLHGHLDETLTRVGRRLDDWLLIAGDWYRDGFEVGRFGPLEKPDPELVEALRRKGGQTAPRAMETDGEDEPVPASRK